MSNGGRVFDCKIGKCQLVYLLSRNPNPTVFLWQGMSHPSASGYDDVWFEAVKCGVEQPGAGDYLDLVCLNQNGYEHLH